MMFSNLGRSLLRSSPARNLTSASYTGRSVLVDEALLRKVPYVNHHVNLFDENSGVLGSYLPSNGAPKREYVSDSTNMLSNLRLQRFFSSETPKKKFAGFEKCHLEEEILVANEQKFKSKEALNSKTYGQDNFQGTFMKQFQNLLTPLLNAPDGGLVLVNEASSRAPFNPNFRFSRSYVSSTGGQTEEHSSKPVAIAQNSDNKEQDNSNPYSKGKFPERTFQPLRRYLKRNTIAAEVEKWNLQVLKNALQKQPGVVRYIEVHNFEVAKVYVKGDGPQNQLKLWFPVKFGYYQSYDDFAEELMRAQEAAGINPRDYVPLAFSLHIVRYEFYFFLATLGMAIASYMCLLMIGP